jgi:hypothetical protein
MKGERLAMDPGDDKGTGGIREAAVQRAVPCVKLFRVKEFRYCPRSAAHPRDEEARMASAGKPPIRDPAVLSRMAQVLELFDLAEEMTRSRLRREHPGATRERIEELLRLWLVERPWPGRAARDAGGGGGA